MKGLIIYIAAILLCLCLLAGCGSQQPSNESSNMDSYQQTSQEEATQKDPSDLSSGEEPTEPVSEMRITITAGEHVISAVLYDNAASRALWDMLPLTLPMMNLYGREMCYRFGAGGLPDDDAADTGYQIGDISYWPPAGSLVILYKQNGEVFEQQPIGHTDDDVSFFDGMSDTEITFEKATADTDKSEQDGFEQHSLVLVIEANGHTFHADFEDNSSAEALKEQLGSSVIELNLHDYGNFEKVGSLPWTLPRNDTSITTVPGDVILYQGNQITIYYDENAWNFTRLAKIRDVTKADLLEAFGSGDVTVRFWAE